MGGVFGLRQRPAALASASLVSLTALGVGVLAFMDPGVPSADVELHDGAVWLTNQSTLMVGHLNHPSQVLDGAVRTTTSQFDVLQSEDQVLVHDWANNVVSVVDPATMASAADVALPLDAVVAMGGGVVAVLDPNDGRLWVMAFARMSTFDAELVVPLATVGAASTLGVTPTGVAYAVSGDTGDAVTATLDDNGSASAREARGLPEPSTEVVVTSVGEELVVWDQERSVLHLPSGATVDLPQGSVVQQASASTNAVAVATPDSLMSVPLDGTPPTTLELAGTGLPAAPVYLNGCTYAAWAGVGIFVRDCSDDTYDKTVEIDGALPSGAFVFRVNRDLVVLNDYINGTAWLATEGMEQVNNWDDLLPPPEQEQEEQEFEEEEELESLPDRDEPNTPPVAEDDEFGARAGRTTVLPIVDNDYDLDGDVLTAIVVDATGVTGEVQSIRGGAALQVVLPDTATGTQQFEYRVSDGRGGVDDAVVTVNVAAETANVPPETTRRSRISLEAGAQGTYNVIPDWADGDGDSLFLRDVLDNGVDTVDFSPDGAVTVTANPDVQGTREIIVIVSDGRTDVQGVLRLDVWPAGTQAPQTNADHVVTSVDQPIIVSPLGNDLSRSGLALRLAKLSEIRGATVVPDWLEGTFTFSSSSVGTFYVQYLVTDGPSTAANLVRIDVMAQVETSLPPIAVSDVALVAPGDDTLVDVLANDSDPTGGVLVIQGVDVPQGSGVNVAVLEHRLVRVTNVAGITEPVVLTYRVSNGVMAAEAEITVMPIDPPAQQLAPVAVDDEVVVRAGDIATVSILDNDYHPSGARFELVGLVEPGVEPAFAEVFTSEHQVRIKAGAQPGQETVTYDIVDESGQRDSAVLRIRVLEVDAETNAAPRTKDVTARVLNGNSVRIPIPLNGIDPDGDSVTLLGADGTPALGRVVQLGQDWLIYEAYSTTSGTDVFGYVVRDRLGAEATGTVTVGVAPAEYVNHPPIATRDQVSVRPNRAVSYPVLANDSDPDSDLIFLETELVVPEGVAASVVGERIVVEAAGEGEFTIQYTVSDVYGASSHGTLFVQVDPETPQAAPIARDDKVLAADIAEDGTAVVLLLDNDEDPDGVASQLTIDIDPLEATLNLDSTVTVTAQEAAQVITYTITDADGLSASAFILVPGVGDTPPRLISTAPIEVKTGDTKVINLADYIVTANGNPAIVTEAERVAAAHTNGDPLVVDATTLTYTSAEGYVGKDGITLQVTDGLTLDDPAGRTATLTIPINVMPTDNEPPTFRNTSIAVTPGEEPVNVDLRRVSADPNPEDVELLEWDISGAVPSGLTAQITDGQLAVSAASSVAKGSQFQVTVTVTDGKSAPVEGLVEVSVTGSTRTMPVANDDRVEDARPGVALDVRALANDLNPFPETPMTIVGAVVESGSGTVTHTPELVTITPAADFFGTLVVRYTVQDATEDIDRRVDGRITVTVVKEPDAPPKPEVKSVEDRTVVLEWTAPPSNGAPITGYQVVSDQGTSTDCPSSICTITGLSNDVEYRFNVIAINRIGPSQPSPASEIARPDVRPDQPLPPTLTFGDASLDIEWQPATTAGSPIRSYTLEISPAPPGGAQKPNLTGTSYTWTGLENGVAYQVRIQAFNDAPDPSTWSDYSASEVPAGPPDRIEKPTTSRLTPVGDRAQIGVQWVTPSGNGDTVSEFTVRAFRAGAEIASRTVSGTTNATAFELETSNSAYTFTVTATNKAGTSSPSVASDPRRAFVAPGAPTGVTAVPGDRSLTVSFTPGSANGADAAWITYQYELNGNGSWNALPGSGVISGLANGSSYTVRVRAVTTADGASYTGNPSAASAAQRPFGQIGNPSISSTGGTGTANFTITAPATNGRPIDRIEIRDRTGSGAWSGWTTIPGFTGGTNNQNFSGLGSGVTKTIEVRVYAVDTPTPGTATKSQTTTARVSYVTKSSATPPECSGCKYYVANWSGFTPGTYTVACRQDQSADTYISAYRFTITVNSSGAGSQQLPCYFGYPGYSTWLTWETGPGAPFDSETRTW
jgi:hypothetical protein